MALLQVSSLFTILAISALAQDFWFADEHGGNSDYGHLIHDMKGDHSHSSKEKHRDRRMEGYYVAHDGVIRVIQDAEKQMGGRDTLTEPPSQSDQNSKDEEREDAEEIEEKKTRQDDVNGDHSHDTEENYLDPSIGGHFILLEDEDIDYYEDTDEEMGDIDPVGKPPSQFFQDNKGEERAKGEDADDMEGSAKINLEAEETKMRQDDVKGDHSYGTEEKYLSIGGYIEVQPDGVVRVIDGTNPVGKEKYRDPSMGGHIVVQPDGSIHIIDDTATTRKPPDLIFKLVRREEGAKGEDADDMEGSAEINLEAEEERMVGEKLEENRTIQDDVKGDHSYGTEEKYLSKGGYIELQPDGVVGVIDGTNPVGKEKYRDPSMGGHIVVQPDGSIHIIDDTATTRKPPDLIFKLVRREEGAKGEDADDMEGSAEINLEAEEERMVGEKLEETKMRQDDIKGDHSYGTEEKYLSTGGYIGLQPDGVVGVIDDTDPVGKKIYRDPSMGGHIVVQPDGFIYIIDDTAPTRKPPDLIFKLIRREEGSKGEDAEDIEGKSDEEKWEAKEERMVGENLEENKTRQDDVNGDHSNDTEENHLDPSIGSYHFVLESDEDIHDFDEQIGDIDSAVKTPSPFFQNNKGEERAKGEAKVMEGKSAEKNSEAEEERKVGEKLEKNRTIQDDVNGDHSYGTEEKHLDPNIGGYYIVLQPDGVIQFFDDYGKRIGGTDPPSLFFQNNKGEERSKGEDVEVGEKTRRDDVNGDQSHGTIEKYRDPSIGGYTVVRIIDDTDKQMGDTDPVTKPTSLFLQKKKGEERAKGEDADEMQMKSAENKWQAEEEKTRQDDVNGDHSHGTKEKYRDPSMGGNIVVQLDGTIHIDDTDEKMGDRDPIAKLRSRFLQKNKGDDGEKAKATVEINVKIVVGKWETEETRKKSGQDVKEKAKVVKDKLKEINRMREKVKRMREPSKMVEKSRELEKKKLEAKEREEVEAKRIVKEKELETKGGVKEVEMKELLKVVEMGENGKVIKETCLRVGPPVNCGQGRIRHLSFQLHHLPSECVSLVVNINQAKYIMRQFPRRL